MHDASTTKRLWTGTDALVLTAACLWGASHSIIKVVLRTVPPHTFNAVRLLLASAVFLAAIGVSRWLRARRGALRDTLFEITPGGRSSLSILRASTLSGRDWVRVALLGAVGHFVYQVLFIEGLATTSVSNAALILGCTPMMVAIASAALGLERLGVMHWVGTALSLSGIYLIVGGGGDGATLKGDLLVTASAVCWTAYTMLGRDLLSRHSPLIVTGYSMAVGTALYLVYAAQGLLAMPWGRMDAGDWLGLSYATFLGFNVAYVLWYAGVQRLGSARTALYSNLVPIVSVSVAALWLGERLGWVKVIGAVAVITGLVLTRVRLPERPACPPSE